MTGMQVKTINNVITRKVDKWLESIDDEDLRKICKRDVIVTGGSIASMLLGEEVNDYDLYFKTYETTVQVAQHYLDRFKTEREEALNYSMDVDELTDSIGRKRVRILVRSKGVVGETEAEEQAYEFDEGMLNEDAEVETEKVDRPEFAPVFLS